MSSTGKRCRQMSLIESFSHCKRDKVKSMEGDDEEHSRKEMREILVSAAEKRIACSAESTVIDTDENTYVASPMTAEFLSYGSEDLFPDPPEDSTSTEKSDSEDTEAVDLKRWPNCSHTLPPLQPCANHTVMFRPHLRDGWAPRPYPDQYQDKWDSFHVRMPCSPHNIYPSENKDGERNLQSRWIVICNSLKRKICTSVDLETAIMEYNKQYIGRWDFSGLHAFFNRHIGSSLKNKFFESILPNMIDLALQLPQICTQAVPLLHKREDHFITLSQKQISCLLANAFFCTFPRRNASGRSHSAHRLNTEYASFPDINFKRLFCGSKHGIPQRACEKLKCILNYFSRVTTNEPTGTVTFHRQYLQSFPNWAASAKKIQEVVALSSGVIETEGHGLLQMDFANRFVGGGVLGQGCVQEEIRFCICPELIVARLFTECLGDSESLIITGIEQYNKYTGYGDTFSWDGDFQDSTPRDAWGRKYTQVVAIDAQHFHNYSDQFKLPRIKRELNKAYSGFFDDSIPSENLPAVATGNWGCGAFKGYPNLKFLIQLMAASHVHRGLLYFTFGNQELKKEIKEIYSFLVEKEVTVGGMWSLLESYGASMACVPEELRSNLFEFIYRTYSTSDVKEEEAENTQLCTGQSDSVEDMWPNFSD